MTQLDTIDVDWYFEGLPVEVEWETNQGGPSLRAGDQPLEFVSAIVTDAFGREHRTPSSTLLRSNRSLHTAISLSAWM